MNGIAWSTVQKMMVDAPGFDADKDADVQNVQLTNENSESILNYINNMM